MLLQKVNIGILKDKKKLLNNSNTFLMVLLYRLKNISHQFLNVFIN